MSQIGICFVLSSALHKTDVAAPHPTQDAPPDPSGEVTHQDFDLDVDGPTSYEYPPEASDVTDAEEIKEVLEELAEQAQQQCAMPWKSKARTKNIFKKEPR